MTHTNRVGRLVGVCLPLSVVMPVSGEQQRPFFPGVAHRPGRLVYVDVAAPGPVHDGLTWCTAFTDLQPVLEGTVGGDEVRVADGVYRTTYYSRYGTFYLKGGVTLKNGYAGCDDPEAKRDIVRYTTTLSGDRNGDDVGGVDHPSRNENCYNVVTAADYRTAKRVIDGFTITGGNANSDDEGHFYTRIGGGIRMATELTAEVIVSNCRILENYAIYDGGGIILQADARPVIVDCEIRGNYCEFDGGGS